MEIKALFTNFWFWLIALALLVLLDKNSARFLLQLAGLSLFAWWAYAMFKILLDSPKEKKDYYPYNFAALVQLVFALTILFYVISSW